MPQKCVQVKDRVEIEPNEKKDCPKFRIGCGDISKTPKMTEKYSFRQKFAPIIDFSGRKTVKCVLMYCGICI